MSLPYEFNLECFWLLDSASQHWKHIDNLFVTGCTWGCQNDNLRCSQWREGCQYDDLLVSVNITLSCIVLQTCHGVSCKLIECVPCIIGIPFYIFIILYQLFSWCNSTGFYVAHILIYTHSALIEYATHTCILVPYLFNMTLTYS